MYIASIILAILLGLIPANIADKKGKNFTLWWFFGAALFIVALPMAILATPERGAVERQKREAGLTKCPFCAEYIKKEASVCRFCGRDIPRTVSGYVVPASYFAGGGGQRSRTTSMSGVVIPDKRRATSATSQKIQIHIPASGKPSSSTTKQIHIPAKNFAALSQTHAHASVAQEQVPETPSSASTMQGAPQPSNVCPHCQAPIDIAGLPAGTYECPNCQGKIELE